MVHDNKHDVILTILITVLVFLNIILFTNGMTLDCEKCTIKFKNVRISGAELAQPMVVVEIKARELFEEFKNEKCLVIYDRVQGYLKQ